MLDLKPAWNRQADLETWVFWDITRCPVPSDVDARLVGPFIRRALKSLGYNGPLTITAIGILSQVPIDVLRALSSTGINLHHVPTTYIKSITTALIVWEWNTSPPANLMLISLQRLFSQFIADLSDRYYVLGSEVPYDCTLEPTVFERRAGCFLWESLLTSLRAETMVDSNPGAKKEECSGTTGKSTLYCSGCYLGLFGFESFSRHILTKEHALEELDFYHGGVESANKSRARKEDATAILARLEGFRKLRRREEIEEEEEEEEEDLSYKKLRFFPFMKKD